MAKHEFQFEHGLTFGKGIDAEMQYDVVLRELTTGDIIDAREAAEKVIFPNVEEIKTGARPMTVVSEVQVGLELARRQVANVGEIQGPLTVAQLRKLHPADFEALNNNLKLFDDALAVAEARGRVEQSSE